jgi:cytochrome c-type biogenesis protein CcmH
MSKSLRWGLCLVALLLPLMPVGYAVATEQSLEGVTKELMCQCGCGMTVPVCSSSMECMVSSQINDVVRQQLSEGRTKGEIIDYFINIYGERILAAPTKSGFNVTAWVTPFVAVIVGVAIVSRLLLQWRRRPGESLELAVASPGDEKLRLYEELVDRDLKEMR